MRNKDCVEQYIKTMLRPVLILNSVLACLADCPADNHARQLAQFLYGTFGIPTNFVTFFLSHFISFPS